MNKTHLKLKKNNIQQYCLQESGLWIMDPNLDCGLWIRIWIVDYGSESGLWIMDPNPDCGLWIQIWIVDCGSEFRIMDPDPFI